MKGARMSNKERQQRFREKRDSDPVKRVEYLAKRREKYLSDLKDGKRKNIDQLTEREKRSTRRQWKTTKRDYRKRKKLHDNLPNLTPPNSPEEVQEPSHQRLSADRKKKRSVAKCYRDNKVLRNQLKSVSKRMNMYRMRLLRQKMQNPDQPETPRSKTRNILKHWSESKHQKNVNRKRVARTLNFHYAMTDQLNDTYRKGNNWKKKSIEEILTGKIMKKYGLGTMAKKCMGVFSGKHKRFQRGSKVKREAKKLLDFFERDDVSRLTAGQKQTITVRGIKKQRRILNYSLQDLHEQFMMENKEISLSYASFCRQRPWWVLPPRQSDRETCSCKIHENTRFLAIELKKKQLLNTDNLRSLVSQAACSTSDKMCMYGNCRKCKDVRIIQAEKKIDLNEDAKWFQWVTKKETRMVKSEEKEITLTQKDEIQGKVGDLIDEFHSQLERFKIHSFNIENQLKHYRWLKENMKMNEVMVHVDFAENYDCKLNREIQSMHFGASKRQITLHTGVYRVGKSANPVSFCSISDSLEHGPPAIWAHLEPVLKSIKKNPNIDTIHFFSDGPSSQYRQKGNFQLFTNEMADYGFKYATWNYHEAGHGKGAPDGVGAALKRSADFQVLHGNDICNASDFVRQIREKETGVELYEVSEKEIVSKHSKLIAIKTVPGTLKIHQIITTSKHEMFYRDISCSCSPEKEHINHKLKKIQFKTTKSESQKKRNPKEERRDRESDDQKKKDEELDVFGNEAGDQEEKDKTVDRGSFFEDILHSLSTCKTFANLKEKCEAIKDTIQGYDIGNVQATVLTTGLPIDETALTLFPTDVPGDVLYPVCVKADGNCLPYTGSVIAFGNDNHATEIRVRIIVELALNSDLYLSQEYLQRGLSCPSKVDLAKSYAMYSEEYVPDENNRLDQTKIKLIYEKETLKITKKATYMGIWQLFALATVLGRPIYSIYPQAGNQHVREDLNRVILPQEQRETHTSYIMWTSTRFDMTERNWIPNHFVAALPISLEQKPLGEPEKQEVLGIKIQRWRLLRKRKLAKDMLNKPETETEVNIDDENDEENAQQEKKTKNEKEVQEQLEDQQIDNDLNNENRKKKGKIDIETEKGISDEEMRGGNIIGHVQSNKEGKTKHLEGSDFNPVDNMFNFESPKEVLNKYVVIQYNGKPYPGFVVNIDEQDVRVRCMHRIGKLEKCHFYWPRCVTDESLYDMEDVIAIIPEPVKFPSGYYGHFRSKTRNDFVCEYRQLAKPQPPNKFLNRSQQPTARHVFSHHDNRESFLNDALYFEQGLGRKRAPNKAYSFKQDFMTWMPEREYIQRTQRPLLSTYRKDFKTSQKVPQIYVNKPPSSFDGVNTTSYRYAHGSETANPNRHTINAMNNEALKLSLLNRKNRAMSARGTVRETVASCMNWYNPAKERPKTAVQNQTSPAATQTTMLQPHPPSEPPPPRAEPPQPRVNPPPPAVERQVTMPPVREATVVQAEPVNRQPQPTIAWAPPQPAAAIEVACA